VQDQEDGKVKEARLRVEGGNAKMDQKVILALIVAGVFGSVGFVFKEWTTWTSTTLVDLNKRTAIMETEIRHTNIMVSQNHEMLKSLIKQVRNISYGDRKDSDGTTNINWEKAQKH